MARCGWGLTSSRGGLGARTGDCTAREVAVAAAFALSLSPTECDRTLCLLAVLEMAGEVDATATEAVVVEVAVELLCAVLPLPFGEVGGSTVV